MKKTIDNWITFVGWNPSGLVVNVLDCGEF